MFNHYSTDYANHVHQLSVSVSKHYWITKEGIVKYQIKPMEVRLAKVSESPRTHLIVFIVRDHFSGLYYSRCSSSQSLMTPMDFLTEAWTKKPDFAFSGLPTYLAVPDTVEQAFPGTRDAAAALGIGLPKVTSGFHGGIRDVRTVEERLKCAHDQPLEFAKNRCLRIGQSSERESSRERGLTKAELWTQHPKNSKQ